MAAKKAKPAGSKSYILTMRDKTQRKITIPAHWKLTFGALIPYSNGPHRGGATDPTPALRVYEGTKENLRAAFRDVMEFRDESIELSVADTAWKAKQKDLKSGDKDVDFYEAPVWKPVSLTNGGAPSVSAEPEF